MTDHVRNMENAVRPALALGMLAFMPIVGLFAPFIVLGVVAFVAYVFLRWTWMAAMLPFAPSDTALDAMLTKDFGAPSAIWGASVTLVLAYVLITGAGWWYRDWKLLSVRRLVAVLGAYGALVFLAGAVTGTHFPAQVSYAWSHPNRSALSAWTCPGSLASGKAEKPGPFDLYACRSYVDEQAVTSACRQVMRAMAPLAGPQMMCTSAIRQITNHEWPVEGREYKEWETGFKKPYRNLPLATPDRMRILLAKEGLTPRT